MSKKIITISREYGSGGRELGVRLAKALGIPFYDKEVISMAADDMEIAEEAFRRYDEQIEIPDYLNRERSRFSPACMRCRFPISCSWRSLM